ncbi:MAG: paraslipin [SAR324 cluster bacterium]|nr:paraslipin [SAR324 cluster bacterium]
MTTLTILLLVFLVVLKLGFIIVPNHQNLIKERFGKFQNVLEPGFHFLIPLVDKIAYRVDIREQFFDVERQNCISKDNIQVSVDGIVYLKVFDSYKACYGIENYARASTNMAQTTMRSEIGKLTLDQTFSERDSLNENIVKEVDRASDPWGIKVLRYEIKDITPSETMIATLEQQMEAEREKRAEITIAEAHKQATINASTGEKQERINYSEGERTKRINEAEGKAQEIRLVSEATAKGINMISDAISKPGGNEAVAMQIKEHFIEEFGEIVQNADVSVVPAQLANIKGFFEGITRVSDGIPQSREKV